MIDVLCNSPLWAEALPQYEAFISKIVADTMHHFEHLQPYEIAILLLDDEEMSTHNQTWRQKNQPTNVLSFPQYEGKLFEDAPKHLVKGMNIHLGDILLSYGTIKKEAQTQGKSFQDHLCHLLIHGVLHLIGYDHIKDNDQKIMEALEIQLLQTYGITNPYDD